MAITLASGLSLVLRTARSWTSSHAPPFSNHTDGVSRSSSSGAVHPMGQPGQAHDCSGQSENHADAQAQAHAPAPWGVKGDDTCQVDEEQGQGRRGSKGKGNGIEHELMPLFENGHCSEEDEKRLGNESSKRCSVSSSDRENCDHDGALHHTASYRCRSKSWCRAVRELCCGSKLSCLLPMVPVSMVLAHMDIGHGYVFGASLLAIAPLAERLGYVTEQLAAFTGATVGGLLNATFGNATEMIISIFALRQNMIRVVQLSLLGSILSNMLLVLGCAFFCGGLVHHKKDQKFNKATALVSSGLLLMAVMGLLFPAVLHATHTEIQNGKSELALSRFTSCVMLVAYGVYLFFQLKSHRQLYDCEEECDDEDRHDEEEEDHDEEQVLGFWGSIFWLGILTILISLLSDCLVDAIMGASKMWNVPVAFISVVILPIVGNAAEHASAIMFAVKDKLNISLGVAIGSSTQISMFVIPFCVVVGWIMGKDMDLNFRVFETATLFSTVLVVASVLQEGTANYFKGLMLVLCYLIVSASYWVHVDNPDDIADSQGGGGS